MYKNYSIISKFRYCYLKVYTNNSLQYGYLDYLNKTLSISKIKASYFDDALELPERDLEFELEEGLLDESVIALGSPEDDLEADETFVEEETKLPSRFEVSIDSEFNSTTCLSVQIYVIWGTIEFEYFIVNEQYQEQVQQNLEKASKQNLEENQIGKVNIIYSDFNPNVNLVTKVITDHMESLNLTSKIPKKLSPVLYMYYSFKDISNAFGLTNMMPYYLGKKRGVSQKRNITGTLSFKTKLSDWRFQIKDLFGMQSGGLKVLSESVGIPSFDPFKEYKENMEVPLVNETLKFIRYGMNDCKILPQIYKKKVDAYNKIMDYYKMPEGNYFTERDLPCTVGSTVFKFFDRYMKSIIFKSKPALILSFYKQGILNKMHKNYQKNLEIYKKICSFKTLTQFEDFCLKEPKYAADAVYRFSQRNVFTYTATQYASTNFLVYESKTISGAYLGMTTGGRTSSEDPFNFVVKNLADIDIQGAYGNCLAKLLYPIGRPRMYLSSNNDLKDIKLGDFMKKYKKDFESGLYKISVKGKLTFEQDLIFSKIYTSKDRPPQIEYDKADPDVASFKVPFALLRKEILHGFITPYVWTVLTKVCSNQEMAEINNLTVESCVYWSNRDRVNTIEELADKFISDKKTYGFDSKLNCIVDKRTYAWFGVSLTDFLQPLIKLRKEKKELAKKGDSEAQGIQESCKLTINSLWGIITSIFFNISNVVISEIVTGNIRASVWLITRALNACQVVTDGCFYSLMKVNFLNLTEHSSKPGLETFSNREKLLKHNSITTGPLANQSWDSYFKQNKYYESPEFKNLDEIVRNHLVNFWKPYNLDLEFFIEHKMENLAPIGSYISKAHYCFKTYDPSLKTYSNILLKMRGFRKDNEIKHYHPLYYILLGLLESDDYGPATIPNQGFYEERKLLKLNSWRMSLEKQNGKLVCKYGPNYFPGDSRITKAEFRLNNMYMPILTCDEYIRKSRRSYRNRLVVKNGEEIKSKMELFEKYIPKYRLSHIVNHYMKKDILRDTYKKNKYNKDSKKSL